MQISYKCFHLIAFQHSSVHVYWKYFKSVAAMISNAIPLPGCDTVSISENCLLLFMHTWKSLNIITRDKARCIKHCNHSLGYEPLPDARVSWCSKEKWTGLKGIVEDGHDTNQVWKFMSTKTQAPDNSQAMHNQWSTSSLKQAILGLMKSHPLSRVHFRKYKALCTMYYGSPLLPKPVQNQLRGGPKCEFKSCNK